MDHSVGGIMHIVLPTVLVVCVLLSVPQKALMAAREAPSAKNKEPVLVPLLKALTRPFLVTLAGFGAFLQMFGYLRGL